MTLLATIRAAARAFDAAHGPGSALKDGLGTLLVLALFAALALGLAAITGEN